MKYLNDVQVKVILTYTIPELETESFTQRDVDDAVAMWIDNHEAEAEDTELFIKSYTTGKIID